MNPNKLRNRNKLIPLLLSFSIISSLIAGCAEGIKKVNSLPATAIPTSSIWVPVPTTEATATTQPESVIPKQICEGALTMLEYYLGNKNVIDPQGEYDVTSSQDDVLLGILPGKMILDGYPDERFSSITAVEQAGTGLEVCYGLQPDGSISPYPKTP